MPAKTQKPGIQLQSFADMLDFPTKPGTIPVEHSPSLTVVLPIDGTEGFPNHEAHFPLYTGERLADMVESIRRFGVQTPILVWQTQDSRYIIISGHNRVNAAQLAGLTEIPAMVRSDLTAEAAEELFFEMNFRQRSLGDMLFSQRVLCVAAHYNLLKRQGRRTDLTSPDSQEKLSTDVKVAEEYELTRDKVSKYCRYAILYRPLLQLMDEGKQLGQLAAYEVSFIEDQALQEQIYLAITEHNFSLSKGTAKLLRKNYEAGRLDRDRLWDILTATEDPVSAANHPVSVKLPPSFRQYFAADATKQQIEETIQKALALYFQSIGSAV